ncbi:tyrosine-type recombinase/integrase [Gordonia crocea]|uniref:Putative phage integrase n=1 Tax=Gordonia crocea TaxID=589162 RepID=A0A7M3SUW4_9ACTN|nr:tyrosine-type recombinase/integrase [Gordonia crocea]GED96438.1 putative phage integrase [Gordonia crocea]
MGRPTLPLGTWGKITRTQVSDGRWRARARYRDYDGHTRVVERYGASGAKAERTLIEALKTRSKVRAADADITRDTRLADLAQAWLQVREKDGLAQATLDLYAQTVNVHITPGIGQVMVGEATVGVCERFVSTKTGTVAKRCRMVLTGMMQLAAQHDAVDRNPVRETTAVNLGKKTPKALDTATLAVYRHRVAAWCAAGSGGRPRDTDLPDLVEVLIGTGARINEVLPIEWADLHWGGDGDDPATLVLHRSKSPEDEFVVVLPDFAVKALRRQRKRKHPGALVFPSHSLTVRASRNVNRQLREARNFTGDGTKANPDLSWVTPHTLRRTVATVVAEALGDEAAAGQLGHSSPTVTRKHYIDRRWASDVTGVLDGLAPVRGVSGGFSVGELS